ncbi:AraC family transcriptional regulator [Sphingobacteriaceae bacterium]|nr:AraC family transcriptional regulator [Sphingobacteriaceae bacterium]
MSQVLHKIPLNKQNARAIGGLDISNIVYEESLKYLHTLKDHRDDYYVLVILTKGKGTIQCDMEKMTVESKGVFLIKPYQVHSAGKISTDAEAYFISIAPFLMPDHCANTFQSLTTSQQYLKIPAKEKNSLLATVSLLHKAFAENNTHKTFIIHSLFNALINRVTAIFVDAEKKSVSPKNQAYLITQKFKQLVSEFSFLNLPSFFSEKLSITTSHLNDSVKATTGMSVTNYLQNAMLLEAKRNLYYTNDDVKTVAFTLGFEDHAYFSRLFKKLTKETPLLFRNKFRE